MISQLDPKAICELRLQMFGVGVPLMEEGPAQDMQHVMYACPSLGSSLLLADTQVRLHEALGKLTADAQPTLCCSIATGWCTILAYAAAALLILGICADVLAEADMHAIYSICRTRLTGRGTITTCLCRQGGVHVHRDRACSRVCSTMVAGPSMSMAASCKLLKVADEPRVGQVEYEGGC